MLSINLIINLHTAKVMTVTYSSAGNVRNFFAGNVSHILLEIFVIIDIGMDLAWSVRKVRLVHPSQEESRDRRTWDICSISYVTCKNCARRFVVAVNSQATPSPLACIAIIGSLKPVFHLANFFARTSKKRM